MATAGCKEQGTDTLQEPLLSSSGGPSEEEDDRSPNALLVAPTDATGTSQEDPIDAAVVEQGGISRSNQNAGREIVLLIVGLTTAVTVFTVLSLLWLIIMTILYTANDFYFICVILEVCILFALVYSDYYIWMSYLKRSDPKIIFEWTFFLTCTSMATLVLVICAAMGATLLGPIGILLGMFLLEALNCFCILKLRRHPPAVHADG